MYSTHNEGKFVVAERFIRTLKTKIYKYMTSISKNVYIDKLNDIVNEYNHKSHRTIKMKPADVKDNAYIDFGKEVNNKDCKFKVGGHVRISKYKNIFAKGYTPNWSFFQNCLRIILLFTLIIESSIINNKYLHAVFSFGIFLPWKFVFTLSPYTFIFVFMYLSLLFCYYPSI